MRLAARSVLGHGPKGTYETSASLLRGHTWVHDTGMSSEPTALPTVYAVILNWHGAQATIECLEAFSQLEYANKHVIVVDNGSTDGSPQAIAEAWPEVEILQTGRNLGYGGGNNAGIRAALAAGADFVWIVNNDTVFSPDVLTELVLAAQRNPSAGLITPKILYRNRPGLIECAGGSFNPWWAKVTRFGAEEVDKGQHDQEKNVSFASGCSLLIRRQLLEAIDSFDERYFMYWEDVDYSVRAADAGWELLYAPRAVVFHTSGGSSDEPGGMSALFLHYNTRNYIWYLRRNMRGLHLALAVAYALGYFAHCGLATVIGKSARKKAKLQAIAVGIWEGVRDPRAKA